MKTTQRQILSQRFITLFNRYSENESLPYEKVAKALNITVKTLEQYLTGVHLITIEEAYTFCEQFIDNYGYMFQDMTNWQNEVADKLNCGFQSNQPAIGGFAISDSNDFSSCINKKVKAQKRRFSVERDSMTGGKNNIEEGDWLDTELLRSISDFKEGSTYVLETGFDGICVKELRSRKEDGKIVTFNCISDLDTFYKPFEIIGNEYTKAYKVTRVIKESKRIRLKNAVRKDKTKDVFKALTAVFCDNNDLILLENRFNNFQKLIFSGIIDNNLNGERNKINVSLLNIIDEIEDDELVRIDLFKL